MSSLAQRLYARLVRTGRATREGDEEQQRVSSNGLRIIGASALQNAGDQVVNASTVLPWLLASLGAPLAMIGMLVPIRESGSLLPQAALSPRIQRRRQRKWVWVAGAAVQAVGAATMALATATLTGVAAGAVILAALALFSLGRSLTSISSKDVMSRTIPKGQRGQITGISTLASGLVAVTIGLGIRLLGGGEVSPGVLAGLLVGGALAWVAALAVFASVREPQGEEAGEAEAGWLLHSWRLLADDAPFRKFVLVRTLLLVSSLSQPFIVALAAAGSGVGLSGLGPFVIASGIARIIGGRVFGRFADRSSRRLMMWGALAASVLIVVVLLLAPIGGLREAPWFFASAYLVLALIHTGVRVARKTYVIDMAEGDRVTDYVAVSNTAIGVLLLVTGAVNAALAQLGTEVALAFLAALGFVGVVVARTLPEVSETGTS